MLQSLSLKFRQRVELSADEQAVLDKVPAREKKYLPRQDIVSAGSRATTSCMVIEGLSARYKLLSNGRRQITAINVPGDFVDLQSFLLSRMEYGVTALTPCRVLSIEHDAIRRLITNTPSITRLLWMDTMLDASIHQEWIVSMGRRSAFARLAHLICELFLRLKAVDRTEGHTFRLPLTQSELADILGLSIVHVNRILKALRAEKIVVWSQSTLRIDNWDHLKEVAEFQPDYLSLKLPRR